MKKVILNIQILLFFLISISASAQLYDCGFDDAFPYTIIARSGLTLRKAPATNSEKIMAIPFDREVMVCDQSLYTGVEDEIDGIPGIWLRVFYKDQEGYMFSGFLRPKSPVRISVIPDHSGNFSESASENNFTLYGEPGNFYDQTFSLTPFSESAQASILFDPASSGPLMPETYRTPLFSVSGIEKNEDDNINGRLMDYKFLYPGEEIYLKTENAAYLIYSKGQLISSDDELDAYRKIKNYELRVKRTMNGYSTDKTILNSGTLHLDQNSDQAGWISVYWMGDLDGDGELDLLLNRNPDETCTEYMLLLSSKADPGYFMKLTARQVFCPGC